MPKVYILMADVIESRLKAGRILASDFRKIVKSINQKKAKQLLSPLTITLGDEFQGLVHNLSDGAEIIISLEEEIIKRKADFKLRYVLYYGEIETSINKKIAYGMLGSGLSEARNSLEALKSNSSRRIFLSLKNQEDSNLLENMFYIFTSLLDAWKPSDYYLIAAFIELKDYRRVAKKLSREISLMWKREKTLMIRQYFAIKTSIQQVITKTE